MIEANEDYVEYLIKARNFLRETKFGELVQDKKFIEAKFKLLYTITSLFVAIDCLSTLEKKYLKTELKNVPESTIKNEY